MPIGPNFFRFSPFCSSVLKPYLKSYENVKVSQRIKSYFYKLQNPTKNIVRKIGGTYVYEAEADLIKTSTTSFKDVKNLSTHFSSLNTSLLLNEGTI